MKKVMYLVVLVAGIMNAQVVNIPDANFKAALIANGIDTNADGNIQTSEAQAISILEFTNPLFTNVVGIESFSNLNHFRIDGSLLTSLNLTSLTQLQTISCNNNAHC